MSHAWIRTMRDGIHFSPLATMVVSIVSREQASGRKYSSRDHFYLANGMEVSRNEYEKLFDKLERTD